ncbi:MULTISPECIES: response regulator transcription factor [Corynebacterium]|uniref:response regulator transcription factor n=1 Tax=Corynebacterium TaxID=1716 RepID=UPI00114D0D6E|nr:MULTISPECIES: response regulator transcription factor [Corynebacterium]MCG7247853.1 response regulator transcription factor [Corynebacterium simulans]
MKYSDMPCLLAGIRDDEQSILDELRRYFLWPQVECVSTQRELLNALSGSQEQLLVLCERKDSATWVWDIQELKSSDFIYLVDYSQHSREKLQTAINLGASAYCVVTREARSGHGGLKISCCFEINGVAVGTMPEPDMQRNLERLSAIQLRILNGIVCGHSNYGIAEETHLSVPMIKKIVSQLLDIFAAENRVQLAIKTLPAMG